jgi:hypothetical protein
MEMYGEVEVELQAVLTLQLGGGAWLVSLRTQYLGERLVTSY